MSNAAANYRWKEVADLPGDLNPLEDPELESLTLVWDRYKTELKNQEQLRTFTEQLAREWSIETGIIEGVYTLDRGITQTLIERGLDSSYIAHDSTNRDPQLVTRIIQAHREMLEGVFAFVAGERELRTSYIKELHAGMLQYQDTLAVQDQFGRMYETQLEKGVYKRSPNNPVRDDGSTHEYCPPEHDASEMDRLLRFYGDHKPVRKHAHIESAWLQHAFTQIHPFQDGNGRVARALASLVFIKHGLLPLVVTRDDRARYIEALEIADEGDLGPLTKLFSTLQKRALTRAISYVAETKPVRNLDEAIKLTRDLLSDVGELTPAEYRQSKVLADELFEGASFRLREMAYQLTQQYQLPVTSNLLDLRTAANALMYEPNFDEYLQSISAPLVGKSTAGSIVVSFHGVGVKFTGLIAAVAYFKDRSGEVKPLGDVFRITYLDESVDLTERFLQWLDACLIEGLAVWRRQLK